MMRVYRVTQKMRTSGSKGDFKGLHFKSKSLIRGKELRVFKNIKVYVKICLYLIKKSDEIFIQKFEI